MYSLFIARAEIKSLDFSTNANYYGSPLIPNIYMRNI